MAADTGAGFRTIGVQGSRSLPKASVMLADELRAKILANGLEPGDALPSETDIIEQSGLGRASVREALRLLESQGLLVIRRGSTGGIFVAKPDLNSFSRNLAPILTLAKAPLRELTIYRKTVEPTAAALAAESEDVTGKQELLELATHAPGQGYANEVGFHERVAELADNMLLRVLIKVPHDLLREHLKGEAISTHDLEVTDHAHIAIAKAIVDGDAERASRAMLKHVEAFEARMDQEGRLDRPIVAREQWLRELGGEQFTSW